MAGERVCAKAEGLFVELPPGQDENPGGRSPFPTRFEAKMSQQLPEPLRLRAGGAMHAMNRMWVMGVLNANPDSFSDSHQTSAVEILLRADSLVADGADVLDVGGQSAITGRSPVAVRDEIDRVIPVLRHLEREHPTTLASVDTYKLEVAKAALSAGAAIINDVSGLADERMAELCASYDAGLVVMHTSAPPLVRRQAIDLYTDVERDVDNFLLARMRRAIDLGLSPDSVILDPGPDFTKTPAQTLTVLRRLATITNLERPTILALSRKDFLGAITGRTPRQRDAATFGALACFAATPGFIARVHDVAGACDVIATVEALAGLRDLDEDYVLPDELRHEVTSG